MSSSPFYSGLDRSLLGVCITPLMCTDAAVIGRSYRRCGTTARPSRRNRTPLVWVFEVRLVPWPFHDRWRARGKISRGV